MEPNGYQFPQIVISSGERQVWPDGNAFGVVLSGERQVWPDGALAANTPLGWTLLSRGWHCPWGVFADSRRVRRHYFATRKTPLNTCCILQRSTKDATSRCMKLLYTFRHRTI